MSVRRSSCRWRAVRWRNLEWILTSSFLHHLFSVHSDRAELADCWRNNHLPPTTRRGSLRHRRQSLLSRSLVVGLLSSDGCCGSMDTIWSSEDRMGSGPTLRRARPNRPPNGAHALALVGASMCPQTCRNELDMMSVRRSSLPLRLMSATWCCHPRSWPSADPVHARPCLQPPSWLAWCVAGRTTSAACCS